MKDRLITDRPHIATPQDSPPRDRHMSRAEYARFLAACQTYHVKLFAMLALETAARAQAILDLTWDRVDLERGMVDLRLHRFARMKGRGVKPIGAELVAALSQAKEIALTGHVIEYGGAPVGRIVKGVRASAVRAGMPWITPHVFRHSAAVWLVEDGHSMAAVAQFLDHADSSITERVYARYSPTFLRSMAATLASGSSEHPSTTHARKKTQ
jgi:integrase